MQWRKLWKKCCDEVEFAEKLNTLPPEEQCRQLSLIAAEDRQCGRKLFLYLSAASVFEQVRERSAFELGQFEEEEVCRHLAFLAERDSSPAVRVMALRQLSRLRHSRPELLLPICGRIYLMDESALCRMHACAILCLTKQLPVRNLLRFLSYAHRELRLHVLEYLNRLDTGEFEEREIYRTIKRCLTEEHDASLVRAIVCFRHEYDTGCAWA